MAKCLVARESSIQKLKCCKHRNTARLLVHVGCYNECNFIPWRGLPKDGFSLEVSELIPDFIDTGLDSYRESIERFF